MVIEVLAQPGRFWRSRVLVISKCNIKQHLFIRIGILEHEHIMASTLLSPAKSTKEALCVVRNLCSTHFHREVVGEIVADDNLELAVQEVAAAVVIQVRDQSQALDALGAAQLGQAGMGL